MPPWLAPALDYIPQWIEFQLRLTRQPGCAIAVVHKGKRVLDAAWGVADIDDGTPLTPRHRFRIASHSKTFTAAGMMKLREGGRLKLDDPIGDHVAGLHPAVAAVTLAQLLSHTAGLVRDGADTSQWALRRPFKDEAEIRDDLAGGTTLEPNTRFKYSNHGFALLGMAIESITGQRFADWIAREVIAPAGLAETTPDAPPPPHTPVASGHTAELPLGRRIVIPAYGSLNALAPAGGFVSTAADVARFFSLLAPGAKKSPLSAASRREMTRRQWRDPHSTLERWYGLGTISGSLADWDWFGHSGSLPGFMSRTAVVPSQDLAITVLTHANDGMPWPWLDGCLHILRAHAIHGPPSRRTADWTGRWWSPWSALDLVPMKKKVLVANPALPNPLIDASEIEPDRTRQSSGRSGRSGDRGGDRNGDLGGTITLAGAFASHGEPVRLVRDGRGKAAAFWLAGSELLPEATVVKELESRSGR
jgi:D-alanyl-D-alanine carboxypeptidase